MNERSDIRVLLMSTGGGIGGEETFTTELGSSLRTRGWDVRVAATSPIHREHLANRGLSVEELPIGARTPQGLLRGAIALARYARRENISILHAQSAGPAVMSIIAKELRFFRRPRPAIMFHGHGISHYGVLSRLFNRLDISITVSDYERRQMIDNGLKPEKVVRVHNGIDIGKLSVRDEERRRRRERIREELGLDDSVPLAGFIGRLSPEKAPDCFIESFRHARELLPEIRYLVVGDGPMRSQLEQEVQNVGGSGRIMMTGFRRDVPDIMCAIDLLALVSHVDTFSITTLEAMANRLPLVVTNVCGFPEQVTHAENGLIVPDRCPREVALAITDILRDPDKKRRYGDAGYERVRTYLNCDRMVDEIESIYMETTARGR